MLELVSVITITLLAVISPGADFAMVSRNSMFLSRRAGLLTALGISLGVLVHVTYSMLGIGLLISNATLERLGGDVRQFARAGGGCETRATLPAAPLAPGHDDETAR